MSAPLSLSPARGREGKGKGGGRKLEQKQTRWGLTDRGVKYGSAAAAPTSLSLLALCSLSLFYARKQKKERGGRTNHKITPPKKKKGREEKSWRARERQIYGSLARTKTTRGSKERTTFAFVVGPNGIKRPLVVLRLKCCCTLFLSLSSLSAIHYKLVECC